MLLILSNTTTSKNYYLCLNFKVSNRWRNIFWKFSYGTITFVLIKEEFVIRVITCFGGSLCQRRYINLALLNTGDFQKKVNLQHV